MAANEEYEQWTEQQRDVQAPAEFTDRVMDRLGDELISRAPERKNGMRWTLVIAQSLSICLAVLIAASRLVDLFSATIAHQKVSPRNNHD